MMEINIKWQRAKLYFICTKIYILSYCHANKYIEIDVAFCLPHFAIKYRYPCMNLCLIAHLITSSNQIYNHIHSFDDDFNNWECILIMLE